MLLLFWTSLILLIYAFIGYPLILFVAGSARSGHSISRADYTPRVSILLSAFNEEAVISEKITNFLCLDYPPDLIEMVIVCDNCSDRTEQIIRENKNERLRLLVQNSRKGKTLNLNLAVEASLGDILIFTDANSMFRKDAVRRLAALFASPSVGLVSGRSMYVDSRNRTEQTGGLYRSYEEFIKKTESSVASIVGADGAIYALRKSLYKPLRPEEINDLIHPIQVVQQGFLAISDTGAVCSEVVDERYADEFNRQTRIMAQSWHIICSQVGNLMGAGKFVYLWQVFSHKLLRWLTIPLLLIIFSTNLLLLRHGMSYQVIFGCQFIFMVMAIIGRSVHRGIPRVVFMFLLLHCAAVLGFFRYISGSTYTTWNPRNN